MTRKPRPELPHIGWREWIALPDLGVEWIKVKVDTGARSSSLHAIDVHRFEKDGAPWVRFAVHPYQRNFDVTVRCEAPLVDERHVRSSVGHVQHRPVIETVVRSGERAWPIELTLTNRDAMGFRMLLGRQAVRHRFVVDPGRSYLAGPRPPLAIRRSHRKRTPTRKTGTSMFSRSTVAPLCRSTAISSISRHRNGLPCMPCCGVSARKRVTGSSPRELRTPSVTSTPHISASGISAPLMARPPMIAPPRTYWMPSSRILKLPRPW